MPYSFKPIAINGHPDIEACLVKYIHRSVYVGVYGHIFVDYILSHNPLTAETRNMLIAVIRYVVAVQGICKACI